MSRQDDVVRVLTDGFGEERIALVAADLSTPGGLVVDVTGVEGSLLIDKEGNVKFPEGIDALLHYWIGIDLECLDIMKEK